MLLIGGSYNQSTMMYKISKHLTDFDLYFTPFYCDGILTKPRQWGWLDRSIAGFGQFYDDTMAFFKKHNLPLDFEGKTHDYDLALTCTDLFIQRNLYGKTPIVLVQEGMTDPENWSYHLFRLLGLPHWLSVNTAGTGTSNKYDKFCIASEGYRELFIKKGASPEKLVITGIPNYDNAKEYEKNDFPHKGYLLCATSDVREALKYENRKKTIQNALKIANGKQVIFKLHPNEKWDRAKREIERWAPGALVFQKENVHELIANCDILVTKYSTVVYTGMALGKQVFSEFPMEELKKLTPIQNDGKSAENIANVCKEMLQ